VQGAGIRLLEMARRKCHTAGAHDTGHDAALKKLEARSSELGAEEAEARAKQFRLNEIAREKPKSIGARVLETVENPLVILLTCPSVAELHLARPTAFTQYCGD
jgi:hypothetical protein